MSDLLSYEDSEFVKHAYIDVLGRDPDPGGFVNYLERLRNGVSKRQILAELEESDEGRSRIFGLSGSTRSAFAIGASAEEHAPDMPTSLAELLACEGEQFVGGAYYAILDRAPDPGGLKFYLGQLAAGATKLEILTQLRWSDEGRGRSHSLKDLEEELVRYQSHRKSLLARILTLVGRVRIGCLKLVHFSHAKKLRGEDYQCFKDIQQGLRRPPQALSEQSLDSMIVGSIRMCASRAVPSGVAAAALRTLNAPGERKS